MAELTEDFVIGEMYPSNMPKPIIEATKRHMLSGPSEIVLVKGGDDVIETLLKAVGATFRPTQCDPDTIRFIYGSHIPEEIEEGYRYWKNAAHRSMTNMEAKEDINKFSKFFK